MNRLKVATIVGTRPEVVRLSRVISRLREDCQHTLIHTGQNYDHNLNQIFFSDLDIAPPDISLNAARPTPTQTIAAVLDSTDKVLRELLPDAVLVLGDTNSGLALFAAKRLGIPTFHMEAGNRCFDPRVPEEINRRLIDHLADINLPYSQIAREHLVSEGLPPHRIIVTGSPMREVLSYYQEKIALSDVVLRLGLKEQGFYVASLHREENVDDPDNLLRFVNMFNLLTREHDVPVVMSTHPRTRERLNRLNVTFQEGVRLLDPLSFTDYVRLQMSSRGVLSDSGTISEEASILGFRALNLRVSHERPEAMEEASVIMIGSNSERMFQALEVNRQDFTEADSNHIPFDYRTKSVSRKISRILHSYS